MSAATARRPQFDRLVFHDVEGEPRVRSADLAMEMGCVAPWRLDRWIDERRPAMAAMGLRPPHSQVIVRVGATLARRGAMYWLTPPEVVYVVFKAHTEASTEALADILDRGALLARWMAMPEPGLGSWPWDLVDAGSASDA